MPKPSVVRSHQVVVDSSVEHADKRLEIVVDVKEYNRVAGD